MEAGESAKETEEKRLEVNEKPGVELEAISSANAPLRSHKMKAENPPLELAVHEASVTWQEPLQGVAAAATGRNGRGGREELGTAGMVTLSGSSTLKGRRETGV